jgi:hypothetical protein
LQLDGFHRTRANINADHAFLSTFKHHALLLTILNMSRR